MEWSPDDTDSTDWGIDDTGTDWGSDDTGTDWGIDDTDSTDWGLDDTNVDEDLCLDDDGEWVDCSWLNG